MCNLKGLFGGALPSTPAVAPDLAAKPKPVVKTTVSPADALIIPRGGVENNKKTSMPGLGL